jgi:hypothetical protein
MKLENERETRARFKAQPGFVANNNVLGLVRVHREAADAPC